MNSRVLSLPLVLSITLLVGRSAEAQTNLSAWGTSNRVLPGMTGAQTQVTALGPANFQICAVQASDCSDPNFLRASDGTVNPFGPCALREALSNPSSVCRDASACPPVTDPSECHSISDPTDICWEIELATRISPTWPCSQHLSDELDALKQSRARMTYQPSEIYENGVVQPNPIGAQGGPTQVIAFPDDPSDKRRHEGYHPQFPDGLADTLDQTQTFLSDDVVWSSCEEYAEQSLFEAYDWLRSDVSRASDPYEAVLNLKADYFRPATTSGQPRRLGFASLAGQLVDIFFRVRMFDQQTALDQWNPGSSALVSFSRVPVVARDAAFLMDAAEALMLQPSAPYTAHELDAIHSRLTRFHQLLGAYGYVLRASAEELTQHESLRDGFPGDVIRDRIAHDFGIDRYAVFLWNKEMLASRYSDIGRIRARSHRWTFHEEVVAPLPGAPNGFFSLDDPIPLESYRAWSPPTERFGAQGFDSQVSDHMPLEYQDYELRSFKYGNFPTVDEDFMTFAMMRAPSGSRLEHVLTTAEHTRAWIRSELDAMYHELQPVCSQRVSTTTPGGQFRSYSPCDFGPSAFLQELKAAIDMEKARKKATCLEVTGGLSGSTASVDKMLLTYFGAATTSSTTRTMSFVEDFAVGVYDAPLLNNIRAAFGSSHTDWGSTAFINATRQASPYDSTQNMDAFIARLELFERLRHAHAAHSAAQEAALLSELRSAMDFDPGTGRPILGQGFDASSTERDDTIGATSMGSQHLDVLDYGSLDPASRPKSLCDLDDAFVQNIGFGVELPTTGGNPQGLFSMSSAGNRLKSSVREIPKDRTLRQPFNNSNNKPPDDKDGEAKLDVLGNVILNLSIDPRTGNLNGRIGYNHVWRFGFPSIPVAPGVGVDAGVAASLTIAGDLQVHNGARIPECGNVTLQYLTSVNTMVAVDLYAGVSVGVDLVLLAVKAGIRGGLRVGGIGIEANRRQWTEVVNDTECPSPARMDLWNCGPDPSTGSCEACYFGTTTTPLRAEEQLARRLRRRSRAEGGQYLVLESLSGYITAYVTLQILGIFEETAEYDLTRWPGLRHMEGSGEQGPLSQGFLDQKTLCLPDFWPTDSNGDWCGMARACATAFQQVGLSSGQQAPGCPVSNP